MTLPRLVHQNVAPRGRAAPHLSLAGPPCSQDLLAALAQAQLDFMPSEVCDLRAFSKGGRSLGHGSVRQEGGQKAAEPPRLAKIGLLCVGSTEARETLLVPNPDPATSQLRDLAALRFWSVPVKRG